MNWVRENKFLTGFIAVMVVGAGVLGYLLYSAWGTYSDVSDQYNAQAQALQQLQSQNPYPDGANLKKFQADRDALIDATHKLAGNLSQMVLPVTPLTSEEFQDHLRDVVTGINAQAGKTGVKLPDHFALDFDTYLTQPPSAAAAPLLGRQLAALQIAVNFMINDHVDAITSLKRTPLPQEAAGGGGGNRRPGGFGGGGGGIPGRRNGEGGGLVEKVPFDVNFTATQASVQRILNDLASSDKQFFIVRSLIIANSDPKPISKADAAATPAAASAPAAPAAGQPAISGSDAAPETTSQDLKFLVGTEKLNVAMRIEMVTFNIPDSAAHPGGGPNR